MDDAARAAIRRMRDAAEAAVPMSLPDVLGQTLAPPELFNDVVIYGITWVLGYGIEQQIIGPTKHLSISHPLRRMLPVPPVLREMTEEFGLYWSDCEISMTSYPRRGLTLHILQAYRLIAGR